MALWLASTEAKSGKTLCWVEIWRMARMMLLKLIPESSPDEPTINLGVLPGVEALNSAVLAVIFWGQGRMVPEDREGRGLARK